jgi:hypothetical protein
VFFRSVAFPSKVIHMHANKEGGAENATGNAREGSGRHEQQQASAIQWRRLLSTLLIAGAVTTACYSIGRHGCSGSARNMVASARNIVAPDLGQQSIRYATSIGKQGYAGEYFPEIRTVMDSILTYMPSDSIAGYLGGTGLLAASTLQSTIEQRATQANAGMLADYASALLSSAPPESLDVVGDSLVSLMPAMSSRRTINSMYTALPWRERNEVGKHILADGFYRVRNKIAGELSEMVR